MLSLDRIVESCVEYSLSPFELLHGKITEFYINSGSVFAGINGYNSPIETTIEIVTEQSIKGSLVITTICFSCFNKPHDLDIMEIIKQNAVECDSSLVKIDYDELSIACSSVQQSMG